MNSNHNNAVNNNSFQHISSTLNSNNPIKKQLFSRHHINKSVMQFPAQTLFKFNEISE